MDCLPASSRNAANRFSVNGSLLRQLFAIILVFCDPLHPEQLWEKSDAELSEDYTHRMQVDCGLGHDLALLDLDDILQQFGKHLYDYEGIPIPDRLARNRMQNGLLLEETMFDAPETLKLNVEMERTLNLCQRMVYNTILSAVEASVGGLFFLDGPGGSGKTYLYNCILCWLRGHGLVALACASSEIASLLLSKGRTAHSRFKIPLNCNANTTCNMSVNSHEAEVVRHARLIIWDEAPMTNRYAFEALNRTMRDIMQTDSVFGGKVILFGRDFRQVFPIVPKGFREDIVDATLCRSRLWSHVKVLTLTQNMCVNEINANRSEENFCDWLLNIGNGTTADSDSNEYVKLPEHMLLQNSGLQNLFVYKEVLQMSRRGAHMV
ncbi:hypothetical protein L7F22_069376 [Adiantum nelumboides]|nr:hypothetical protein [Adiantum nelumboides]